MGKRGPKLSEQSIEIAKIVAAKVNTGEMTYADVCRQYGVCRQRIQQIARKAGVHQKSWCWLTDAEKERILKLHLRDVPLSHIAQSIGRSKYTVFGFLVRCGLHVPAQDDKPWSDKEVAFLRKHYGERGAARRIAEKLGRTRNEVIGKANRTGLCRPHSHAEAAA